MTMLNQEITCRNMSPLGVGPVHQMTGFNIICKLASDIIVIKAGLSVLF